EYDEEVGFAARRRLMGYACEPGRPFALVASFMLPHDPYVALPRFWDAYEDAAIDLPQTPAPAVEADPFSQRVHAGIGADAVTVNDDDIRRARRGYYANVSYFDSKVGEILRTVEETGQLDNTIFIVTSDHGDMLGERGLWYKMSFFDHSARVPLVIAGPGIVAGTVDSPCSLVDLLPTMLDFAGAADMPLGQPVDGRSLAPMARGGPADDGEAIGEYCAEMTASPVVMIRRGSLKYVHCDDDPAQLYDLASDPCERANLAADPAWAETAASFAADVAARWNTGALREHVLASQASRRAVHDAMQHGRRTDWDHNPHRDAAQEYVRNHIDWTVAAEQTRYPPPDRS
ncbi:MAG: sulfatase-like hydrolase/transferase, partial [Pseudomonadota bacterium]|nr:sulfatase-like hydrolase/transferase [Pseudomonadota bacterium]MEC8270138.1 sulfatase-like hydrolase/transferase [Pseudomonadota bacterium]